MTATSWNNPDQTFNLVKAKGNKRFRKKESTKTFDETFDLSGIANDRDMQDNYCL